MQLLFYHLGPKRLPQAPTAAGRLAGVRIKEAMTTDVARTGAQFISSLGDVLSCWVQKTASVTGQAHKMGRFHCARVPPLSITDYLKRIRTHFLCSDECFVMALVYIDRASKAASAMTVCKPGAVRRGPRRGPAAPPWATAAAVGPRERGG